MQVCTSGTRVLVPEHLYEAFLEIMVEGARQIRLGDPTDPDTTMGPIATEAQYTPWFHHPLSSFQSFSCW